jgi:hypothetical protein
LSEPVKNPFEPFFDEVRRIVREEITRVNGNQPKELLEAEALADRLKVPVSWVYEQSRLGNIPTVRLGKYVRFDLAAVLESQNKKDSAFPLTRIK